jgi:hypothetical protein
MGVVVRIISVLNLESVLPTDCTLSKTRRLIATSNRTGDFIDNEVCPLK